ncbi:MULTISPECIES: alcohol dehydrogenase catalytic domain-containing protein [unclassified Bradyrhizobium]|uniref:alcohol dehydrogenase catalytic domain-containing protein n=1 Tax=unclassified Bradyrhizobium TaxID=2631580 RepID=UPI001FD873F3|nr:MULTISPECIES: alcohol dehydrogenase catalytic domain-containing protein [unclassified Bradyrhizobium]MCP3459370.1 alcohol dehydrogenase catalytic domain-containing protein [Bradyrhizobium sp. CCGUVB23]
MVRVELAGICGTDLHVIAGDFAGIRPGAVIGHEFVGEVVTIGSAVTRFKVGDRVMASDFAACGHCRCCDRGDHWECSERAFFGTGTSFGPALAGAQAELVRVPYADTTLGLIPKGCSDEAAILLGDNLATGWAAVERSALSPGEIVAVIGGGTVGQLASLSAQAAGAGAVIVVEPSEARREFARSNGSLAASPQEARALITRLTDGEGADVIIEAVGSASALTAAFDLVRKRGRIISVGAHAAETWPFPLARGFANELTLGFAIGDSIRLRSRLLSLITTGALDPTVVVDRRIGFGDASQAYADLKAQRIMKAVIDPRV